MKQIVRHITVWKLNPAHVAREIIIMFAVYGVVSAVIDLWSWLV